MDSRIGLLAAAAALRALRPDAELVLSSDPQSMPWGPRTPDDVAARALACAEAAAAHAPDALIVACNTASVHALPALRAALEPGIPVIGTVPAIKPAAAPPISLYGSAHAVAAQALRRIGAAPAPDAEPSGALTVILGGRSSALPDVALAYAEGRAISAAAPVR